MGTDEIIAGLLAVLLFGLVAGALLWDVLVCDPLRARLEAETRRRVRIQIRERTHRGTPYRAETVAKATLPLDSVGAFDLDDNDRWSRKAGLRSVS